MNNTKKPAVAFLKAFHYWRLRLGVVGYFVILMTLLAPISPVHTPALDSVSAQATPLTLKEFAYSAGLNQYGWDKQQARCLNQLWGKESAWNHEADNPHSTAFGIAQMLGENSTDPYVQISNGLRYIEHRYSNPCAAWDFWKKKNWY